MVVVCCGSPYIRGVSGLSEIFIFQSRVAAQKCGVQNNIQVISCVNWVKLLWRRFTKIPQIRKKKIQKLIAAWVWSTKQLHLLRQCLLILFSEQHFFAGDDQILFLSSLLLAAASRWLVQCRSHVRIFTPKYIAPLHLLLRDDNLPWEVTNTTYFYCFQNKVSTKFNVKFKKGFWAIKSHKKLRKLLKQTMEKFSICFPFIAFNCGEKWLDRPKLNFPPSLASTLLDKNYS